MSTFEPQGHELFHNELLSPGIAFVLGLLMHSIIDGLHVSGILNLRIIAEAEEATETLSDSL